MADDDFRKTRILYYKVQSFYIYYCQIVPAAWVIIKNGLQLQQALNSRHKSVPNEMRRRNKGRMKQGIRNFWHNFDWSISCCIASFLKLPWSTGRNVSPEIGMQDVTVFSKSCMRVSMAGGYIVVILLYYMLVEWYTVFSSHSISVLSYPYGIYYNSNEIIQKPTLDFPRECNEYAFFASRPGKDPERIVPIFKSFFHLLHFQYDKGTQL